MYYVQIDIRPTSALSFRRFPGSILHMATYPFVPPSAMSGYLRRLLMLREGCDGYPNTTTGDAPYYVLPFPTFHVLGAYPVPFDDFYIHSTYRQGIRDFKHTAFSKLVRKKESKQNYQLHTWEYLLVDRLTGYVVSESPEALQILQSGTNYGCKMGKEGYAFTESVSGIFKLEQKKVFAVPNVLIPSQELRGISAYIYFLYRHEHTGEIPVASLGREVPNDIIGFKPFWAALATEPLELDFWTDGRVFIPVSLLDEV